MKQLSSSLWLDAMPFGHFGVEFGVHMTVVRLENGGLWVCSPIELTPALRQEIEAIGPVAFLVSPFDRHYMHLAEWARAFPEAEIFVPPTLDISKANLPDPQKAWRLKSEPEAAWAGQLEQLIFEGNPLYAEVVFCHRPSQTLILTDLCFNISRHSNSPTRVVARLLGILGRFAPSLTFWLSLKDRQAARRSLEQILKWDFDRIIVGHGQMVPKNGHKAFRAAFSRLLKHAK